MSVFEEKNYLRKEIIAKRGSIPADIKEQLENWIYGNLISYSGFINSKTVLIYYSVNAEIDTKRIIEFCFLNNIKVALPVCKSNRLIEFYYINSFSDLTEGKYNIPAPDISRCKPVTDFSDSICIVPGLCFDRSGARLGYGGGYYDGFLNNHTVKSAGLCFDSFVFDSVPVESHDVRVDAVVTETGIIQREKDK
ncbi:MAG: 5-formyltetrahydrofolate cyclo-ligase [Clostridia bacterium]|nr:5-formyltetrahydrofolate cyclo-ligase [Clostridia bacterium]